MRLETENVMEDMFKFELGFGWHQWTSADVIVEVAIPKDVHDRVADEVGTDKMARLEFGFCFQQIVEERYPELNAIIHHAIDEWIENNGVGETERSAPVFYSLQSSWFE